MTLGSELYGDNHRRKPATRVEREGVKLAPRSKPPAPNITLEQADSLGELCAQLEAKAKEYAHRAEGARAAEWDEQNGGGAGSHSYELDYGLLETFARNVADRIRSILK